MNSKRIKTLKSVQLTDCKSVVYVMSRDQRVNDNFALEQAHKIAKENSLPLVVVFNLLTNVKNRTKNQYLFMLQGLQDVANSLEEINIKFFCTVDKSGAELADLIEQSLKPHTVVFDFSPLLGPTKFKAEFTNIINSNCDLVDTHNIVPVWYVSDKEEFAAYTIRPKLKKLLKDFIEPPAVLSKLDSTFNLNISKEFILFDYNSLSTKINATLLDNYNPVVEPGEQNALKVMSDFIENKLVNYYALRNDPTEDNQSNLSAYLHFGNIYSLTIVNKVLDFCKKNNVEPEIGFKMEVDKFDELSFGQSLKLSAEAFLEELIIRKELADNYCYYNKNYKSIKGAKDWAIQTLVKHLNDKRDKIYELSDLEFAKTNDEAWNAAQIQLITTGKIHGYMRMYWAKKMLEWTKSPNQAIETLIYLNDKYSLDGYDPNGYVGILWSIAGLHDRVWFERPIFGQIRYMNSNGLARKFDLSKYITQTGAKV